MLRFGTDGVRGDADSELTDGFVGALGRAVASVLAADHVLVGRDTRESGGRVAEALAAGMAREGTTADMLGVLPTPAIAFHAAADGVPAAIVSASHNPWRDNGVKVVGADGRKLADHAEDAIESALEASVAAGVEDTQFTPARDFRADDRRAATYVAHLLGAFEGRTLGGLRVVLDCANGATFAVGPEALRAAGADVVVLHAEPDGRNINEGCGSTHPESLQAAVVAHGAAMGLALDGDGDRVLAVDERGALVDGDEILVMSALDLHGRGELRNGAVAVTVMSNLGLRRALGAHGVEVVETPVGDRHVVAAMQEHRLVLGGEQSGHIVYDDYATTGDGLLTGLFVCDLIRRTGRTLSELAAQMHRVPQILENVRVARAADVDRSPAVGAAVDAAAARLGESGRVLVRASGTEPLVRIMVEADERAVAQATAAKLRSVVEDQFGGS